MRVELNSAATVVTDSPKPQPARTQKPAPAQSSSPAAAPAPRNISPSMSFSVQQDGGGRFYYALTNTETGQVVCELPPAELRKLARDIEEFLQKEASRANAHLDTKG